MSEPDGWGALRTACHGCRTMRDVIEQVGPHRFETHSMCVPGDGTIYRRVRAAFETGDVVVERPCPECGDGGASEDMADEDPASEDEADGAEEDEPAEWLLPGFRPPV